MHALRELAAIIAFVMGVLLTAGLITDEFSWAYLLAATACFVISYGVWPSKRRGQRKEDNIFLDILEVIIELPVEALLWVFRILGRSFRGGDGGIDIDI